MAYSHENPWDPDQKYIESTVEFLGRKAARSCELNREDRQDFEQELQQHLLDRLRLFDAERASRRTFIARIAANKALNMIEHRHAKMRNPNQVVSLDDPLDPSDVDSGTYGDVLAADRVVGGRPDSGSECERKVLLRIELETALNDLPPELRALCDLIGEGESVTEMAQRLGIHRDTVDRRRAKIREILRARGLGPEKLLRHFARRRGM